MEWMLLPYRRYADFSGRSSRREYWMFVLFTLLVSMAGIILIVAGGAAEQSATGGGPVFWLGMVLLILFWLASAIPSIAVQVRRFHDQDRSGWYMLLNLIPSVGGIIVLVFMCLEGTRGANRYGPDPLGRSQIDVFG